MADIVFDKDIEEVYGGGKKQTGGLLEDAKTQRMLSGAGLGISALAEMGGAYSGYVQNSAQADYLRLQAEQAGLQAQQRANMLREQLYGQISNSFAGYAARGVDIGSGTPVRMAEMTMKEGGADIQQLQRNAQMQAQAYRAQADILKSGSTLEMFSGMANALAKGFLSYGMLFG